MCLGVVGMHVPNVFFGKKTSGRRPRGEAFHFDPGMLLDCPSSLVLAVFYNVDFSSFVHLCRYHPSVGGRPFYCTLRPYC
jgi:hypothetical protein